MNTTDLAELTPDQRSLRSRIGAHISWAKTVDRPARTKNARDAFLDRFEREVDPDGTLDPNERAKRAEHARKAYFAELALKSAKARRKRKQVSQLQDKFPMPLTCIFKKVEGYGLL